MSKSKIGLTEKELGLLSWYFWKDEETPGQFIREVGARLGHGEDFAAGILNKIHFAWGHCQLKNDQEALREYEANNKIP